MVILFKGDMLWMQNISLPLQGNTHSLLGYHEYHQIAVHFVKILNSLKKKRRDVIFRLKKIFWKIVN